RWRRGLVRGRVAGLTVVARVRAVLARRAGRLDGGGLGGVLLLAGHTGVLALPGRAGLGRRPACAVRLAGLAGLGRLLGLLALVGLVALATLALAPRSEEHT